MVWRFRAISTSIRVGSVRYDRRIRTTLRERASSQPINASSICLSCHPRSAKLNLRILNLMNEPAITPELIQKHNLTPEEYERAKGILGRVPTYTELGIFSVMWSEHCSYKNSRPLLKTFPTKSPKILVGAGEENAGIIDIGDGLAIAFKIESHNHPSAVEPFQGATTGVGGIVRDIFTMGARPVCALNSLRFGPISGAGVPPAGVGVSPANTISTGGTPGQAGETPAPLPLASEIANREL